MFGKQKQHSKQRKFRGQGVIEYAGALVVAAVIVAAGIVVVPPNFAALINTIHSTMADFLSGQVPA